MICSIFEPHPRSASTAAVREISAGSALLKIVWASCKYIVIGCVVVSSSVFSYVPAQMNLSSYKIPVVIYGREPLGIIVENLTKNPLKKGFDSQITPLEKCFDPQINPLKKANLLRSEEGLDYKTIGLSLYAPIRINDV